MGVLFENLPCNPSLDFVNLTSNLFTGKLPSCLLRGSKHRVVLYDGNCLATGDKNQHPFLFCKNEALAVGNLPQHEKHKRVSKIALALSLTGGIIGAIILVGLALLVARRAVQTPPTRFVEENASSSYASKFLRDASKEASDEELGLPQSTSSPAGALSEGKAELGRVDSDSPNGLDFVNLTSNLFTGKLPSCLLRGSKHRVVLYAGNCLATGDKNQHPFLFSKNEALAVGNLPQHEKHKRVSTIALALSLTRGIIGAIILVGIALLVAWRAVQTPPTRFVEENASSSYASKFLRDARYLREASDEELGLSQSASSPAGALNEWKVELGQVDFDSSELGGELWGVFKLWLV
ncbi:putative inactive leucine-rich repeat receptor-like protein kinase [Forsythia ovata]|uniref:Inactive leucine-rich repeat receptor-like protein kinase n=1 Tax=Forsythia ovata TaxID=205694 RepID=A0ABD1QAC6_9LAMI